MERNSGERELVCIIQRQYHQNKKLYCGEYDVLDGTIPRKRTVKWSKEKHIIITDSPNKWNLSQKAVKQIPKSM